MTEAGIDLSERLRDPQGEYRCDLIIALTHSRLVLYFARHTIAALKSHPLKEYLM